ncbi:MAG: transcriptional regulator [Lawsonibacter sp.]|jgi:beta-lactamase regulating signal transducer with metallopeptidase domain|nr:transcriptional regulator [Lawsonibacter sp.]
MGELFLKTLNMSIAASWLILAVVLLRFALKKAPKWIAVLLWGVVAVRLVVPFSFESALSLIPSAETFNAHNIQYETPAISSGIPAVNNAVNPVQGETFATNPAASVNPLYVWTFIVSVIWLIGIAAMLLYAVISYVRVRQSVGESVPYEGDIFLCDHVKSPFILGLVRPKIYLPSSMDAASMEPVIAHEKAHLTRCDHWWKPVGFLILTVHWFNPLCWIAYVLLCRDIELACDEKVIRQMDLNGKKQYSTALLEFSTGRRLVTICPLAFGEVGVKERVKNVLNYKKPAFWLIVVAIIACGVVTVCFATNPKQELPQEQRIDELRSKYPEYFDLITSKGLEVYVWQLAKDSYSFGLMPGTNREKTLEELMSLKGASAAEMALILSTYEIEDENIFVIPWGNPISSYMVGTGDMETPEYINNIRTMLGLDGVSMGSAGGEDTPTPAGPDAADTTISEEQAAIRQAILEHNKSSYPLEYDVACCSFITLETLSATPLAGSSTHKITYYGWALYEQYRATDNGLETTGGSHIPVVLSFDLDERGYTLTEYWEPRDGSYFAQDIREKFPAHIVEDALHGQKFVLQQTQECYAQAIAATGLDANQVIGSLIETICSSPALSSNPGDYIAEHSIEYRELTYYGRYTLKYCFARFEEGNETGLDGHIMMQACEDIAASWGEALLTDYVVITGQVWYDAFKSNALGLMEQYAEIELAERYPMSYLLLSMLGKV